MSSCSVEGEDSQLCTAPNAISKNRAAHAYSNKEQAANAYKVGGLNGEAGDAYMKAAEVYRDKLSDFQSASKCLNSAGTTH